MYSERKESSDSDESLLADYGETAYGPHGTNSATNRSTWLQLAMTATIALVIGALAGRLIQPSNTRDGLLLPPGNVETRFQHNLTFTQKPDGASEAAWSSLIPAGRGFVYHEELAPSVASISVFHAVHCLHAIVIAYYDALEAPAVANVTEIQDLDEATHTRIAVPHIRHCFDYIRQSLLCSSDTNLEELDHETHLTDGWGLPKMCRDHQKVFAWAEKYANSTETGIVT